MINSDHQEVAKGENDGAGSRFWQAWSVLDSGKKQGKLLADGCDVNRSAPKGSPGLLWA